MFERDDDFNARSDTAIFTREKYKVYSQVTQNDN